MGKSWLPEGGENVFQRIKAKRKEAEAAGIQIVNMAIGQPRGPALASARMAAAQAVLSDDESMHEYQDNGSPGVPGFPERFALGHVQGGVTDDSLPAIHDLIDKEVLSCLPIPGIKPMLGLVILACGSEHNNGLLVATTTNPGYPTPKVWCGYLKVRNYELPINPENAFVFDASKIPGDVNLLHLNYPHNPSGAGLTAEDWREICGYCESRGIRVFNDAAYAGLIHHQDVLPLSAVAFEFPDLEWAEAFSASKLIGNGTGWRVGGILGTKPFVGDIKTIKGQADSGHFAPAAAGAVHALEYDIASIDDMRSDYGSRIAHLTELLSAHGMAPAVSASAGFFTLWQTPKQAFGQEIASAEHFNTLMIEKTGVLGVPFGPYIRYAVVEPLNTLEKHKRIAAAFGKARVSY
jgi:aspartate/methionine/tyrosine aminotransferase